MTAGKRLASEFVTETFKPLQKGQPPVSLWVMFFGVASHSWSGPFGHVHQTFLFVPAVIFSGERSSFLVGCHCAMTAGKRLASEFVTDTLWPLQHGQPVPPAT